MLQPGFQLVRHSGPIVDNEQLLATISDRLAELANGKQKLNWSHYLATLLPVILILISSAIALGWRLGELEAEVKLLKDFADVGERFTASDGMAFDNRLNRCEALIHAEVRELRREMRAWHHHHKHKPEDQ